MGWRADVDDVQLAVGDQVAKVAVGSRYLVPIGKIDNLVAPRRDRRDFDIDAVDTSVGKHVQLRNEAAPDQTDSDFRHCGCLRVAAGEGSLYSKPGPGAAAAETGLR